MKRATLWAVYCGSLAAHGLLGVAMAAVEPPPPIPPRPIEITMAEPEPEPPPPPKEEPPPQEEPELETEAEPPEAEREPEPPKPRPKAPKSDASAKPAKAPFFGGHFEGGGAGGLAVPQPSESDEPERKPLIQKTRDLSKKPSVAQQRTCGEPIVKPKPIEIPQPAYPEKARAAGLEGKVRLKVTVGVDGKPKQIAVLASLDPELDQAARRAMKDARFEPGTQCGKAVSTSVTISVKFSK